MGGGGEREREREKCVGQSLSEKGRRIYFEVSEKNMESDVKVGSQLGCVCVCVCRTS